MHGRLVAEPRLHAWYGADPHDEAVSPVFGAIADALSARYERTFTHLGAALYRDGRDSVAWHGDRIPHEIVDPVVAIISLGERRVLRMRPKGGGPSHPFVLHGGDLFVMGGTSQRTWEHSVPKTDSGRSAAQRAVPPRRVSASPRRNVSIRTVIGDASAATAPE